MNNLMNMNVQEMSVQEMKKTDGGFLIIALCVVFGLLGGYMIAKAVSE